MSRKRIHVQGDQFTIGDERRPIVTRTGFCLLAHYQRGQRAKARRWLDRIQAQGFDGPRVFAENTEWKNGRSPFFSTLPQVNAYDGPPSSGMRLVNGYAALLERFAEDLDERGMIAEFVCVATIKERDEPWSSNGLNAMAQQLRKLFPADNTPLLHESVNEADAHSRISHEEARRYGARWRRSMPNDPSHHNYPASTIGISMGGEWPVLGDHAGCTHVNVHPPRKGGGRSWSEGPDGMPMGDWVREIRARAKRPVYLNETIHYMTAEQWGEWIPRIPKWSGLSTQDAATLVAYADEVLTAGASFCFHDFVGMGTDPDEPITRGEELFAEYRGVTPPNPPDPPDPPDPPTPGEPTNAQVLRMYGPIVDRAYEEILQRPADPGGRLHHSLSLYGGQTEADLREQFMRGPEFRRKLMVRSMGGKITFRAGQASIGVTSAPGTLRLSCGEFGTRKRPCWRALRGAPPMAMRSLGSGSSGATETAIRLNFAARGATRQSGAPSDSTSSSSSARSSSCADAERSAATVRGFDETAPRRRVDTPEEACRRDLAIGLLCSLRPRGSKALRRVAHGLAAALLLSVPAAAEVTFRDGKLWLNGERREHVIGRSSFKLANIVGYHYAGRGGGKWSLGLADAWVEHNQRIFGREVFLRVLLETEGWQPCESAAEATDGLPQNCMFGSEPVDLGFWDVQRLRNGDRIREMTALGKRVTEWFFETSERTGVGFELVIIATLKHNDVPVGQQSHVVRVTLQYMRELQARYPGANVLANVINEWNAHSRWTLPEVNMLAVRADRWKHPSGETRVSFTQPGPGFEPEQWPGGPVVVDGGGGNTFDFDVGVEPGVFRMGLVHPDRDINWVEFPTAMQLRKLEVDARGAPVGASESMYYVEPEDENRARGWYRSGGWTTRWNNYRDFVEHASSELDYFVIHDEKGVQCDPGWPRGMTRLEEWALEKWGTVEPPPPPPPQPDPELRYDRVITLGYQMVLERDPDAVGLEIYQEWFEVCYADPERECFAPFVDVLVRSDEFVERNTR